MNFISSFLYSLGIQLYAAGIAISSLWNQKAKQWRSGRRDQFEKIKSSLKENEHRVWFHCASVGEFEQGRPVMEAYRTQWPDHKIVLTFFSPSGYELRKNYAGANYIFYLPLDTKSNAKRFIDLIQPHLAAFVKYEFWYHHLSELKRRNIPVILFSGVFRSEQLFFKWYGKNWTNVLRCFQKIFLQDEISRQLLQSIGIMNGEVAGDTRFDRVWQIASQPAKLPIISSFKEENKLFVAGSTWQNDEAMLDPLIASQKENWKWIIVPHEINSNHLKDLKSRWEDQFIFYSEANEKNVSGKKIMLVDKMGFLSSIYSYADIAYIGGGFGKGIHNILEAAVYGIPLIFGPNYQKFNEANELLELGAAKSVNNDVELKNAFEKFSQSEKSLGEINRNYVLRKKGATEKIMNYLVSISSGIASSRG